MVGIDGGRATALSYIWVAETAEAPAVLASGTFQDELRKIDGTWRFTVRRQTSDGPGD